jgi:hypothetical protein
MIVAEQLLIVAGSAIFLVLGSLHLYYTFYSEKFNPRNPLAASEMKQTSMQITKDTTVWNAWIGFNASHSIGAMYFGIINMTLTLFFFDVAGNSFLLTFLNIVTAGFYLFLAKKYWFRIPILGILAATGCFLAALILNLMQ